MPEQKLKPDKGRLIRYRNNKGPSDKPEMHNQKKEGTYKHCTPRC